MDLVYHNYDLSQDNISDTLSHNTTSCSSKINELPVLYYNDSLLYNDFFFQSQEDSKDELVNLLNYDGLSQLNDNKLINSNCNLSFNRINQSQDFNANCNDIYLNRSKFELNETLNKRKILPESDYKQIEDLLKDKTRFKREKSFESERSLKTPKKKRITVQKNTLENYFISPSKSKMGVNAKIDVFDVPLLNDNVQKLDPLGNIKFDQLFPDKKNENIENSLEFDNIISNEYCLNNGIDFENHINSLKIQPCRLDFLRKNTILCNLDSEPPLLGKSNLENLYSLDNVKKEFYNSDSLDIETNIFPKILCNSPNREILERSDFTCDKLLYNCMVNTVLPLPPKENNLEIIKQENSSLIVNCIDSNIVGDQINHTYSKSEFNSNEIIGSISFQKIDNLELEDTKKQKRKYVSKKSKLDRPKEINASVDINNYNKCRVIIPILKNIPKFIGKVKIIKDSFLETKKSANFESISVLNIVSTNMLQEYLICYPLKSVENENEYLVEFAKKEFGLEEDFTLKWTFSNVMNLDERLNLLDKIINSLSNKKSEEFCQLLLKPKEEDIKTSCQPLDECIINIETKCNLINRKFNKNICSIAKMTPTNSLNVFILLNNFTDPYFYGRNYILNNFQIQSYSLENIPINNLISPRKQHFKIIEQEFEIVFSWLTNVSLISSIQIFPKDELFIDHLSCDRSIINLIIRNKQKISLSKSGTYILLIKPLDETIVNPTNYIYTLIRKYFNKFISNFYLLFDYYERFDFNLLKICLKDLGNDNISVFVVSTIIKSQISCLALQITKK